MISSLIRTLLLRHRVSFERTAVLIVMMACVLIVNYPGRQTLAKLTPVPNVVTADIQSGIEKHIEDQSRLNNGYYELSFENKNLRLKLVRVMLSTWRI